MIARIPILFAFSLCLPSAVLASNPANEMGAATSAKIPAQVVPPLPPIKIDINVKLASMPVGEETLRNILVRGNKPFKIVNVRGQGAGLTVKYNNFSNPIHVVTISFTPTRAGEVWRILKIRTDQNETTNVLIKGTIDKP